MFIFLILLILLILYLEFDLDILSKDLDDILDPLDYYEKDILKPSSSSSDNSLFPAGANLSYYAFNSFNF